MKPTLQYGAGKRQNRITIQVASDAPPNGSNEVVPQYLTSFDRFCEQLVQSGREFQNAMQTVGLLQGILKLPYDAKTAAISARDRVVIGGQIYNIAAPPINDGGANTQIILWVVMPE